MPGDEAGAPGAGDAGPADGDVEEPASADDAAEAEGEGEGEAAAGAGSTAEAEATAHEHEVARPDDGRQWQVKVLTVSDAVSTGRREDGGGAALAERLTAEGFAVVDRQVIPDGAMGVASALRTMSEGFVGLIVTTGGTGFGPRDLTPEGTRAAIDREAPGLAEAMRTTSPLGRLSRAVAGTVGRALVVNTPGSPKGAVECLDAVIDVIPHALDLLDGGRPH